MKPKINISWAVWAAGIVLCAGCGGDDPAGTDGLLGNDDSPCTVAIRAKHEQLIKAGAVTDEQLSSWPIDDTPTMVAAEPTAAIRAALDGEGHYWDEGGISGKYWDDLEQHPGCSPRAEYTANTDLFNVTLDMTQNPPALVPLNAGDVPAGVPANSEGDSTGLLRGYTCAAKVYDARASGIDPSRPIVVLQHGNSGSPSHFEEFHNQKLAGTKATTLGNFTFTIAQQPYGSLARELVEAGYQVIASDLRADKVRALDGVNLAASDPTDPSFGDAFGNIDHGWGTPILQHLLEVLLKNTDKQVSVVGHSYGYSVVRDALRRIYVRFKAGAYEINPFTRIEHVVLASGTAHGVANGKWECAQRTNLRSQVSCQMGDRDNYEPTEFNRRLNGPNDLFSAPCADGSYAFNQTGQCDGHVVRYTTITMKDIEGGRFQDEYVSEGASRLNLEPCVSNRLISTENGYDSSGFFMGGTLLANHLGSIRSKEGVQLILDALAE